MPDLSAHTSKLLLSTPEALLNNPVQSLMAKAMENPDFKNGSSMIEKPEVAHLASSASSDVNIDRHVEQVETEDKERGEDEANEGQPPVRTSTPYIYLDDQLWRWLTMIVLLSGR